MNRRIINLIQTIENTIGQSEIIPVYIRRKIYTICGNKVSNAKIFSHCYIGGKGLTIDKDTFINHECFFDLSAPITIGNNCNIGMRCCFITGTHQIGGQHRRADSNITKPINIGNGVWIGANVTILPGCVIGDGVIIAAGSIVVKSCEPNSIYAGIPAKKIKELKND